MPCLKSLVESEGSVSNLNIVPQIKDGNSGDGQILINTGLLPIQNGSAGMDYGINTSFVSLNTLLPSHSATAVFSENGLMWSEKSNFSSYGFKDVRSTLDYADAESVTDSEMLEYCSGIISTMKRPFFLECHTLSMHSPFDRLGKDLPHWITDSGMSDIKKSISTPVMLLMPVSRNS